MVSSLSSYHDVLNLMFLFVFVTELGRTIGHLSKVEKETAPVKHALAVQNALATGNYHRFFKLYEAAPNMGAYLMDHFVTRERMFALTMMSKA